MSIDKNKDTKETWTGVVLVYSMLRAQTAIRLQ